MNHRTLLCALAVLAAQPVFAGDAVLRLAKQAAEASPRAAQVSRDVFMSQADVRDVSMSPDGNWIAFRRDTGQRVELWLRSLSASSKAEWRVMSDSDDTAAYWSGDGTSLWLVDASGIGVFDVEGKTGRRVFRFDPARQQGFWRVDPNAPAWLLLSEKVAVKGKWVFRYLAMDSNGRTRLVHEAKRPLTTMLLDDAGEPRYLAGYDSAAFDTVIWNYTDGKTSELMRCPLPQRCRPVAYSDTAVWALAHNGEDLISLQTFDARSGQWRSLHRDPRGIADAVSVLMEADGENWLAMAYRPDRVEWHGRTPQARARLDAVQAELAGASLDISISSDGGRWLIRAARADWQYDRYFIHDTATKALTPLFANERQAKVPETQLADALPLHWRNKDGLLLHGYVFLPKGIPLETAPVVALIHGGPYNRSDGEMDVAAQLLVNRGHVVFKPNFRASTGYGVNYATGSRGNFGKHGGALDDIISGLDYLLANGIGDPARQAVAGHSFGGYASLLAVTHYPERFAFAVPSAAPVDMAWTMRDIAVEGGSALPIDGPPVDILLPAYGVPFADPAWREDMRRDSPLLHAKELHTPVYLWAGAQDDRVAVETLVRYVAETDAAQRPVLLVDPDSGHSPAQRLNSEALAWLIEAAADRHFGGGLTPPSAELRRFLERNLRVDSKDLLRE